MVYNENLKSMKLNDIVATLDQMYEGFLLTSLDGRIFYANEAVENISGYSLKEIVGKTPKELKDDGIITEMSTIVKTKAPITMIHKLKNGRKIFITSKPIYDENGSIICFAANYRNLATLNYLNELHDKQEEMQSNKNEIPSKTSSINSKNWLGESYSTFQLKEKVAKIAKTEATVFIQGESGTGKEVVANNIHELSNRKDKPFVKINCGAIPEELIESELFGYEKGAFTGATGTKKGLLESANGGTVLLDEIGEMPLQMQVKLLRVIQTKKVMRVGGNQEISLNVRFVAATNRNLKQAVEKGEFREDLYYRLNVIPIKIEPLKNRKDDIIPLTNYFLNKFNTKYNLKKAFTPETLQLFQEYDWPGNVRQLENIIERLVIITDDDFISPDYLPPELKIKHHVQLGEIKPLKEVREEAEMNMIKLALNKFGSIRKAAVELKVDHSTLVRKIQKYGIK